MRFVAHKKENIVKGIITKLLIMAAVLFVSTGSAWAWTLINAQVNYYAPYIPPTDYPDGNGGIYTDPGSPGYDRPYSGKAVIGAPGDTWNYLNNGSGTIADCANAINASTGVTLTWDSSLGVLPNGSTGGTYADLMYGYLANTTDSAKYITFGGLTAGTSYDVYIYTQALNPPDTRKLSVTVNGVTKATTSSAPNTLTDFSLDQNYLEITAKADNSGQLAIAYTPGTLGIGSEANINALQLTPTAVPEPSTYLLLCLSLGVVGFARKRMSRAEQ
jgi:PEP-CTERM motif